MNSANETEADKPKIEQASKGKKWYQLLRHPLVVAFFSSVIFAVIVLLVGTCLQNHIWTRQHQAELAERLFYLNEARETNVWNIYGACNNDDRESALKYWEVRRELINKSHALKQQLAIYFGINKEPELLRAFKEIGEIWHGIEDRLSNYPSCKELKKEDIDKEARKVDEYENKIIEIFNKTLYR